MLFIRTLLRSSDEYNYMYLRCFHAYVQLQVLWHTQTTISSKLCSSSFPVSSYLDFNYSIALVTNLLLTYQRFEAIYLYGGIP
jgi:hypothetical protein